MVQRMMFAIAMAAVVFVSGCYKCCWPPPPPQPPAADLLPLSRGNDQFCVRNGDLLTVHVRNQGTGPSGTYTVKVDFGAFGVQTVTMGSLGAGVTEPVDVMISAGCFSPDCHFTITVASNNDVAELDETNNVGMGICLG